MPFVGLASEHSDPPHSQITTPVLKVGEFVLQAGHPSLQQWALPQRPDAPEDNLTSDSRVDLGRRLFFDPILSSNESMSCATCHDPARGWADGFPLGVGITGKPLRRATPTVLNAAFSAIQMWDGRFRSLEEQAMGPLVSEDEMNADPVEVTRRLRQDSGYKQAFAEAYPDKPLSLETAALAIAAFERKIIDPNTRFDRWIRGDIKAMSASEINGFAVFLDEKRGNCAVCHSAPHFSDDGFHNLGLASFGDDTPDLGRFEQRPLRLMKGAFKTPSLRHVTKTAPYFHDGSSQTLEEVIKHYELGGVVKTNLSPNFRPSQLSDQERQDLLAFLVALESEHVEMIALPVPQQQKSKE